MPVVIPEVLEELLPELYPIITPEPMLLTPECCWLVNSKVTEVLGEKNVLLLPVGLLMFSLKLIVTGPVVGPFPVGFPEPEKNSNGFCAETKKLVNRNKIASLNSSFNIFVFMISCVFIISFINCPAYFHPVVLGLFLHHSRRLHHKEFQKLGNSHLLVPG